MKDLLGKRAFITGAARGIGAAIAIELAERGADIAFSYVRSADAADKLRANLQHLGAKAFAIQADSLDPDAVKASVDDAAYLLGGLDILVNNAGVAFISPLEDMPLDQIDQIIGVNIRAVVLASQAAIPHLGMAAELSILVHVWLSAWRSSQLRSIRCQSPRCCRLPVVWLGNWDRAASL